MIITVTLNAAVDKTVVIHNFSINQVNKIDCVRYDPGGKGINVSKTIKNLGGTSLAIGLVGGHTGEYIEDTLKGCGISTSFTRVSQATRTNTKIIDPSNQSITEINERGLEIEPNIYVSILEKLVNLVSPSDIVVFAGSVPIGCSYEMIGKCIRTCRQKGALIFLDASDEILEHAIREKPFLIKPNLSEFETLIGHELTTIQEMVLEAKKLVKQGISIVALSLGAEGALFVSQHSVIRAQPLKVTVRSTVGAGDAVMAALAYAFDTGLPWLDTIKLACASGAAKVSCNGTQAASIDSISSLIDRVELQIIE